MKTGIRFKLIASLTGIIFVPVILMTISGVRVKEQGPSGGTMGIFIFVIGTLVVAYLLCAYILAYVITRRVLLPLKELNNAAEQIINGNLIFKSATATMTR